MPTEEFTSRREYRGNTLVLETTFSTASGEARIIDCMTLPRTDRELVRLIEGIRGEVTFNCTFAPRFDYASILPWLSSEGKKRRRDWRPGCARPLCAGDPDNK